MSSTIIAIAIDFFFAVGIVTGCSFVLYLLDGLLNWVFGKIQKMK